MTLPLGIVGILTDPSRIAWSSHFETFLRGTTAPIQVSFLSVDQNNPWHLFAKPSDVEAWSSPAARGPKSTGNIALDISSATFALHFNKPMPMAPKTHDGATVDHLSLVDSKECPSLDELGVLPIATSTLVHVPSQMDYTCISMLHLHFLYLSRSSRSTSTLGNEDIQQEVTRNFYELKVLAQARWGPLGSHDLPLHIAALEVMLTTLDDPDGNRFVE